MKRGRIQGLPKFFGYPLLSPGWEKLRISNLASTFTGSIRSKALKNFGEKEVWAYPGTAKVFPVPPVISGTGKAADFKLDQHIQRVHPNKSPLKILE